ncbi:GPO family capsid scaffolding protein [Acinetobacter baumannii]|uniref:GPO family capsid scaffolding protein n=1 Tax=Acinetobacter calcoaceticus/baumannii complex TaxID=909768 RepID=UPI00070FC7E7|nr:MULTISPECIES: GPO family capsid scaffolding protein [Acinetobacter calcoaceticus/baumannii complex]EHT1074208.1 GPO family capsid scaffolding protein [Acinetobacter baumannii]KRJ31928.1 capsid protein [Acinetobacter baumannii]MBY8899567.1 GPO family capsid scaffolding protein [Acinetobacter baumannii]MBY8906815.1 GPO family capsid scaffolding protein [Acinetobacter baumannii]MCZ3296067.1 GPO family capsid scaffolding protein [Acinetobacter baumannii]
MSKEDKKYKSKWFRIAVAGDTTDGREIEANWIIQMAQNYNPETYGARINVEHLRSVYPGGAFGAYGDVLALKTEKVTINGEEKDALFAQIEPTQSLIELNKQKQKVYTSIEVDTNFANKGSAYLIGLAVTDSPASLGTEMLKFAAGAKENPLNNKKQRPENLFTAAAEATLEFEEVKEPQSYSAGLLDSVKKLFTKQKKAEEKTAESFSEQEQAIIEIATETSKQGQAVTALEEKYTNLSNEYSQLQKDFNELKSKLGGEEEHESRPKSGNSNFTEIVDC